jgi:hypothetical protein
LVARLLTTAALWVRIQTTDKKTIYKKRKKETKRWFEEKEARDIRGLLYAPQCTHSKKPWSES